MRLHAYRDQSSRKKIIGFFQGFSLVMVHGSGQEELKISRVGSDHHGPARPAGTDPTRERPWIFRTGYSMPPGNSLDACYGRGCNSWSDMFSERRGAPSLAQTVVKNAVLIVWQHETLFMPRPNGLVCLFMGLIFQFTLLGVRH